MGHGFKAETRFYSHFFFNQALLFKSTTCKHKGDKVCSCCKMFEMSPLRPKGAIYVCQIQTLNRGQHETIALYLIAILFHNCHFHYKLSIFYMYFTLLFVKKLTLVYNNGNKIGPDVEPALDVCKTSRYLAALHIHKHPKES